MYDQFGHQGVNGQGFGGLTVQTIFFLVSDLFSTIFLVLVALDRVQDREVVEVRIFVTI